MRMDNPQSPKISRDKAEGMAKDGSVLGNRENLLCSDHKVSTEAYRDGWGNIIWKDE